MTRIAIIGSGISGLSAAYILSQKYNITLFESGEKLGGHTNTITPPNGPPVDTGFMWCSKEGGPGLYWSKEEADALKSLSDYVLEMGWESSGYSIMLRNIQNKMRS